MLQMRKKESLVRGTPFKRTLDFTRFSSIYIRKNEQKYNCIHILLKAGILPHI